MKKRLVGWVGILAVAWVGFSTGCDGRFFPSIREGTFAGELACTAEGVDPSGAESSFDYSMPAAVTVDDLGRIFINDVELILGAMMLRSIPSADLAFEVTEIHRGPAVVVINLEPRPTLPGITIAGGLVETYGWETDAVHASGKADLLLTDVSGTTALTVRCAGTLPQQSVE